MNDQRIQVIIGECATGEVSLLRELAIRTFWDTYGTYNTPEQMEAYISSAFHRDQLLSELANPESIFFLLKYGASCCGYIKLNEGAAQTKAQGPDAMELERIYVDRPFQGKGLGKLLLEKAVEVACASGKQRIWLGVWEHNGPAVAFYNRHGFVKVDTHIFMLGEEQQLDWVMEKRLG